MKVGLRLGLTDYKYELSPSCGGLQKAPFTYTRCVSIFWASLCSSSLVSIVSELNGQLNEVVMGDFQVPGGSERLDQLAFDCRMSLDYLKGYFMLVRDSQSDSYPAIGRTRSASRCCSGSSTWLPIWHDDITHCHPSNRTDTGINLCW